MKNLLLLVIVLALAAGSYFLFIAGGETDIPDIPLVEESQTPAETPAPAQEKPAQVSDGAGQNEQPTRREIDVPQVILETPAEPPVPDGILVQVTDKATKEPLPEATVLYLDPTRTRNPMGFIQSIMGGFADIEGMFRNYGRKFQTDEKGETRIPRSMNREGALVGIKDNLWAMKPLRRSERGTIKLALSPDRNLKVQVVNEKGTPVIGVPVGITMKGMGRGMVPMSTETKKPDGIAVFRHLQFVTENFGRMPIKMAFAATLNIPLEKAVLADVDLKNPPTEPVRLVIPYTGTVEVLVSTKEGPVADGIAKVSLTKKSKGNRGLMNFMPMIFNAKPVKDGKVVFPFVGVGTEVEATAIWANLTPMFMQSSRGEQSKQTSLGPATPGQLINMAITMKNPPPSLTGIVVDKDGKPLAKQGLSFTITKGDSQRFPSFSPFNMTTTDEQGRFTITPGQKLDGKKKQTLVLTTIAPEDKPTPNLQGSLDITRPILAGKEDLGRISLILPGMLVGGTVRDNRGKPIARAKISIARKRYYGSNKTKSYWNNLRNMDAESGPDGVFAIHGILEPQEIKVMAIHSGYIQDTDTITSVGTKNLTLTLSQSGGISGSLIFPADLKRNKVKIRMTHQNPNAPKKYRSRTISADEEGDFAFESLPVGMVDLALSTDDNRKSPFLSLTGLEILPGKTNEDPRLQKIDLANYLNIIILQLVDNRGVPLGKKSTADGEKEKNPFMNNFLNFSQSARIYLGPDFKKSKTYYGDKATLIVPQIPLDIRIVCRGFRTTRVNGVSGNRTITLLPELTVQLSLPPDLALPAAPYAIRAKLTRLKEDGSKSGIRAIYSNSRRGKTFDQNGQVELKVTTTGTYTVTLQINKKEKGKRTYTTDIKTDQPIEITVVDQDGPQSFPLELKPDELSKSMTTAKAKKAGKYPSRGIGDLLKGMEGMDPEELKEQIKRLQEEMRNRRK